MKTYQTEDGKLFSRRDFLTGTTAMAACLPLPGFTSTADAPLKKRVIASSGESLYPLGMGTWITFNVGRDIFLRNARAQVLRAFLDAHGEMIDSSPMYASSEAVVGFGLRQFSRSPPVFEATKVWTSSASSARAQFADSRSLWGAKQFALLQVHNLVGWQQHLPYLRELKQQGDIRHIGVTTSHGRRHDELARILKTEAIDFVQLTYNILDRDAERTLLPLAREHGISVIANRPFQGGQLFRRFANAPLPDWSQSFGIHSWAGYFLSYILSHPAVTVAIPATSKVEHMQENMHLTQRSVTLSEKDRQRMYKYLAGV